MKSIILIISILVMGCTASYKVKEGYNKDDNFIEPPSVNMKDLPNHHFQI